MIERAKKAGLFIASLLFFLTIVEMLSRLALPDAYRVWPPGFTHGFRHGPEVIHGVASPSRLTINSDGMRGDPLDAMARFRVLAVGGSTTICVYLDDSRAWPYVTQQLLNQELGEGTFWVGNVGRPGHTTSQHLLQAEKLLTQHPEIDALVMLIGANDLLIPLGLSRRRGVAAGRGSPDRDAELKRAFAEFPGWDAGEPWYLRNVLGRLWRQGSWRPLESSGEIPVMDEEGRFVSWMRARRKQASVLLEALPDLSRAIDAYVRNVNAIVDLAESEDVRLLLLTQPTLWRGGLSPAEQDLLWGGGPPFNALRSGAEYYSAEALADGMQQFNRALLGICRQRAVECLDVATQLPRTPEIFYDDAHFTDHGAALLAELVSDYVRTWVHSPRP